MTHIAPTRNALIVSKREFDKTRYTDAVFWMQVTRYKYPDEMQLPLPPCHSHWSTLVCNKASVYNSSEVESQVMLYQSSLLSNVLRLGASTIFDGRLFHSLTFVMPKKFSLLFGKRFFSFLEDISLYLWATDTPVLDCW